MYDSKHIIKKILAKSSIIKNKGYMLIMLIMLIYSANILHKNVVAIEHNEQLITQLQSNQSSINATLTKSSHQIKLLKETNNNVNKQLILIEGEYGKLIKLMHNTINDMGTIHQSVHDISDYQPQQDRKIQNLSTSLKKLNPKKLTRDNKLSPTQLYHIYTTEPYGVILQDKKGKFIIARINKKLPIGLISSISNNQVVAGNKVISKETAKQ